jgi:hypothetical protein
MWPMKMKKALTKAPFSAAFPSKVRGLDNQMRIGMMM